jgi:translation initiation factor IF-2
LSNPQTKEKDAKEKKVRVFELAKQLNLSSKDLVAYAHELGFTGLTNQFNSVEPAQVDALKERVKKGPKPGAAAPAAAPAKPVIPPVSQLATKVQTLPKAKPAAKPVVEAPPAAPEPAAEPAKPEAPPVPETPTVVAGAAPAAPQPAPDAEVKPAAPVPPPNVIPTIASGGMRNLAAGGVRNLNAPGRPPASPPAKPAAPAAPTAAPQPQKPTAPAPAAGPGTGGATQPPAAQPPRPTPPNVVPPGATPPARPSVLNRPPQVPPPRIIAPQRTGTGAPPPSSGQRPGQGGPGGPPRGGPGQPGGGTRAPQGPPGAKPLGAGGKPATGQPMKLTDDMIKRLREASARGHRLSPTDLAKPQPTHGPGPGGPGRGQDSRSGPGSAARIAGRPQQPAPGGDDEDDDKKKGPGRVIGSDSRHKGRQSGKGRESGPRVDRGAVVIGSGGQVETIDERFGSRRGPRAALMRKHLRGKMQQVTKIEGPVEIALPITVRSLSEAIGMKVGELSNRLLKETGQLYGANSTIEFDVASLIAVEKNIELIAKKQETAEDILLKRYEEMLTNVDPAKLKPRPPIVTIMGHVDHGKTSLLDKIRQNYGLQSDVVSTEAGGITQVIRAWSVKRDVIVEKDGQEVQEERHITFLDTPGHEAFTKMRARGANVTDIAVIVVAATDGVMPQTQEAINHAKAAEVKIIVAINKIDMPNANVERTKRQLYNEGLLPDDMGGDVPFVETSAVTGDGISELLDNIILVAEVEELTADPDRPAAGSCLEAYMTADEGVMATVLIQQGTLRRGDIVLCGSTYGRVRAMYNDLGLPTKEAGPSTPVRITGLDRVPNADDPFYVVEELTEAQEIAEAREQKEREAALVKRGPQSLDSLKEASARAKITELKVILKAEARGSVEAIRKELEKLKHEEVTTRVLHAGIGAITESDVQLALTSPNDTLVIGFNVTADDAALRLAEERGISLREYDIIYKLTDDVKAALEGRLKPIEEVVHLGRAIVRETFKISKVGTAAGCYVTSGVIERSARVRVIRQGVVVYPPSDKVVGLDSLRRFKDDVKEVREGFECGMKITGFDDVKVDDVIEAFKIEVKQRTL